MSSSTPNIDTYLIETKPGTESYVDSTLEKYYGDLFTEVSIVPSSASDGTLGTILIDSNYELPLDAIRRINDIERVVRVKHCISDVSGEELKAIESLCANAVTSLPDSGSIELRVRIAREPDHAITASEIERACRKMIRDTVRDVTIGEKPADHELKIIRIDDWVGIAITDS
ncbi:hypothetical protein [Natrinema sp. DC36]|uniref:hypothetical protein n=1 Tax=Natrinema sp. DC36 TaxID=2878680 RepID=UPI001CF01224|nr:hypothetical protein [Natrinema sp. DC36]